MDMLRDDGSRRCDEHRALLGYFSYDSDNDFMRATEFMHQSGLRMDGDHVGKPQDLYLWCSVDGAKNWGLWG